MRKHKAAIGREVTKAAGMRIVATPPWPLASVELCFALERDLAFGKCALSKLERKKYETSGLVVDY